MSAKTASVTLTKLKTLWFNTGTLCNISCRGCYIESTPYNDRLSFLEKKDILPFLDELDALGQSESVGFTGGEPFLNPHFLDLLSITLQRGYHVLTLTNGLKPFLRKRVLNALLSLHKTYGNRLTLRISLDDFRQEIHERERGEGTWKHTLEALSWLSNHEFSITVAGRRDHLEEDEKSKRLGYASLFKKEGIAIDAFDPSVLLLFAEMSGVSAPRITEACWKKVGVKPEDMMCASSRMIVKRHGASAPTVLACTLIAYDENFQLGNTLAQARKHVFLQHRFCAQFCVLGGSSCTG